MAIQLLPEFLRTHYEVHEWKHACAILKNDFPTEWNDIVEVLTGFSLCKGDIVTPGGGKSPIANLLDHALYQRGWQEKAFDTKVVVDANEMESPTHKVDCYKNRIALEIEWNNKDPFFDRDLNNFRLLFELRAISVGVIVTRCDELQEIFDNLGKGKSYGASTTHITHLSTIFAQPLSISTDGGAYTDSGICISCRMRRWSGESSVTSYQILVALACR